MKIQPSLRKNTETNKRKDSKKKKKRKIKKNDIKIDDIYLLQIDKLSLSDIKKFVQGHIANKLKHPGFKFKSMGYSQQSPNH